MTVMASLGFRSNSRPISPTFGELLMKRGRTGGSPRTSVPERICRRLLTSCAVTCSRSLSWRVSLWASWSISGGTGTASRRLPGVEKSGKRAGSSFHFARERRANSLTDQELTGWVEAVTASTAASVALVVIRFLRAALRFGISTGVACSTRDGEQWTATELRGHMSWCWP